MSRLRANQITNENANGAPNFPHGLTVTGIVTATTTATTMSQIVVGAAVTANSGGVDTVGIVTASSYRGDGSQLTGIDASTLKNGSDVKIQANNSGAVVTGEQAPIRTQTDRDILALEEAMAVDLHYIYHIGGLKYAVSTVNPNRTVLETVGSWSKVFDTKNIPIVRATVVSNQD